jgi:serine phosphatase RsbU (regulator of sigma subunit)
MKLLLRLRKTCVLKSVYFFLFCFYLIHGISYAQTKDKNWLLADGVNYEHIHPTDKLLLDSILTLYHQAKHDSTRLFLLNEFIENCNDQTLWPRYNDYMLKIATHGDGSTFYLVYQAAALNNIGYESDSKGNVFKAIEYYNKALKIREQAKDVKGIAESINNLGTLYNYQNDMPAAISYFIKAIKLYEEVGDKKGASQSLNNVGMAYNNIKDTTKAIDYNIRALHLQEQMGDEPGMANSYSNLGVVYQQMKQTSRAVEYFKRSLAINEKVGNEAGIAEALNNLGDSYLTNNDIKNAELAAGKAIVISKELGFPAVIESGAQTLYRVYLKQHKPDKALEMYQLYIQMRDSTNGIEQVREATSSKYMSQERELKLEHEKQNALATTENKKQRLVMLLIASIAIAVAIIAIIIFKNLQRYKKAKRIIERQKEIVEEKQKEILDSIRYAKRIQDAVLKEQEHVSIHLPSHFVLFQPKDIVSGDFYWSIEKDAYWYVAAADCTGHGVPGAFLTILGTSFLNELNATDTILTPAQILDKLRARIIAELSVTNKETNETKDGMDISLARLNLKTNELMWAGANNPLWIISSEGKERAELSETPAHKQPIGFYPTLSPYPNHTFQLNKGDIFYLFTDGYADQFGGPKGKKFKHKKLKDLLLDIYTEQAEKQKQLILKEFIDWKVSYEQTDDVCIIGIKV